MNTNNTQFANGESQKPINKKNGKNARITIRDMVSIVAVLLVISITFLFIALNFNVSDSTVAIEDRYQTFSIGWHLQTSTRDEIVDLPVYVDVGANETITLSKELPKLSQYYAITTRNYHQIMKAYVDGELIYTFPENKSSFNSPGITDDWNTIHLQEDMESKTFSLEFITGDFGFRGNIKPVYLGEDNSLVQYLRASTALPYGMSVSVVAIGGVLVALGIIYAKYNEDKSQIIAGLMLLSIGLWITNRSKMPLMYVGSNQKYYLAFISLMLEAILILLYVLEKFKKKHRKRTVLLLHTFTIFLSITFIIIHIIKFPLDRAVPIAYFAIFLASIYLIYMLWPISFGRETEKLNYFTIRSNKIEFVATVIMVVGICIGIFFDFVIGKERLFTDVGALPKIALNTYAIGQILVHVYRGYRNIEEREELQGKLHDSQLELMMGQIQPHFIFNTLSSIRTLVKVDPDTAYSMIYDFSNYLRANVDNVTNLEGIKFASEVEHIKSYVNIERVRFGDRLHVEYDIKETEFIVPPLSIQPLVENAIKHGVTKKVSGGTVWLRSYSEGNYNVVEVDDDGLGFTPERLAEIKASFTDDAESSDDYLDTNINLTGNGSENHKSSGMRNIYLRLKEMSNAELELTSVENEGTKVRVLFPKTAS